MRGKQAIKNIMSGLILQLVTAISGILLPRYYLLAYGSPVNGMVSSVTQFMTYLMLLEAGISAAAVVGLYAPLAQHETDQINGVLAAAKQFYKQSGTGYFILVVILAILYPLAVQNQVSAKTARWMVLILSGSNLIDYFFLGKYRVLLTADQRGYVIIFTQAAGVVLNTIVILIMIQGGFSILAVKFVATAVYICRSVFIYGYVRKRYPYLDFQVKPVTDALSQRWSVLFHQVAGLILNNNNIVIITLMMGQNALLEVSVYTIYQMIANLISSVLSSFTNALTAGFGDVITRGDRKTLYEIYSEYEFIYFMLLLCSYFCMFFLCLPFVAIYTNGIQDADYIRSELMILFVLSGFLCNVRVPGITLIMAAGHYKQTRIRAGIETCINLALSLMSVRRWGITGVLSGTAAAFLFSAVHVFWYCNRYLLPGTIRRTMTRIIRSSTLIGVLSVMCILHFNHFIDNYAEWGMTAVLYGSLSLGMLLICNYYCEPVVFRQIFNRCLFIIKRKANNE